MTFLDAKPIEFSDFSGGLTDNFLQGGPTRYAEADNFLLSQDHKLEVRSGTRIYDPMGYTLSSGSRIAGLFTGINETLLFAHSNQDIYTQSGGPFYGNAWAKIQGPTGNSALGAGGSYAQVTTGEFQRQIYYTSDAAVLPGKLFRDQNNAWKAVTAGMPYMAYVPNYPNDTTLLAACITLANALRVSMISHFTDEAHTAKGAGTSLLKQHRWQDKWSLGYIQAVVFNGTDPEYPGPTVPPTPAPAATDAASLYTLCLALSYAYEHHRNDLAGGDPTTTQGAYEYHQEIMVWQGGGGAALNVGTRPSKLGINTYLQHSGTVADPTRAAAFLDDLAQKWYWHQLSPFSHSPINDLAIMSQYQLNVNNSTIKIGTIYSKSNQLHLAPDYSLFIAFVDFIRNAWEKHAAGTTTIGQQHTQIDVDAPITLSDPVDFDSCVLMLFWMRWLYGFIHLPDAQQASHTGINFTSTITNATLTAMKDYTGGDALIPPGSWIYVIGSATFTDSEPLNRGCAYVNSSTDPGGAGNATAVMNKTAIANGVGVIGQYSVSRNHLYNSGPAQHGDSTTADEIMALGAGYIGTDLRSWVAAGVEFVDCLAFHMNNAISHTAANRISGELTGISAFSLNPYFVPVVVDYAWAAFYRYQYVEEQNGILYVNNGPPVFSESIQIIEVYPVGTYIPPSDVDSFVATKIVWENYVMTLSGIPTLANTGLTNYDTTVSVTPTTLNPVNAGYNQNLTIEIYRTTNSGTTFYFLKSLTNGTTSYLDTKNDSSSLSASDALNLQPTLYTSGGVLANEPPPQCKFLHAFGGFMYYGAVYDTGQFFPQRVRQSVQNAPDSSHGTLFDDLEDDLVGLSSTRSNLIGFCRNSLYRFSGSFTSTGQGGMSHERIADSLGCLGTRSIVKTEIGLFYAGTDGFYFTDGYQNLKISLELNDTYAQMTRSDSQKSRIYGGYDKLTRRVWWAMQSETDASDNDVFFVFYLDYGIKPSGTFTTARTKGSWKPASACFFRGELVIGDSRGYLFKTDSDVKTDPKIDTSVAPSLWATLYLPWSYISCALDMGSSAVRKWITRIHCVGQNVGDAALQIYSINNAGSNPDNSSSKLALGPIQYTKNFVWGDATQAWGDDTFVWKYDGMMDVWRDFPSRSFLSTVKQVQYSPGNFVVYKYDKYPEFSFASVNATAKTATIATPSGYNSILWPLDVVDMYISFDTDLYATSFLVTALDATKKIITFSDVANESTTNVYAKWQITGIKKNQRVRITSFDLKVAFVGDDQEANPGPSADGGYGSNA